METEPQFEDGDYSIKLLKVDENTARPILTSFPQNVPDKKDETSYEMLMKRKTATLRSVDSEIPQVGKFKKQADSVKYAIGYIDEGKKTINLLEILHSFSINRLLENDKKTELIGLNTTSSGMEHREMITQEIGTKKGKKILQQMKNKVIKEDTIHSAPEIKELMAQKAEEMQKDIEMNTTSYFQKEYERKKEILPDFNLSAKSAGKIYSLDSIIPPSETQFINTAMLENEKFINQYTKNLKQSQTWEGSSQEASEHKKKLLFYLNCLLTFFKIKRIELPLQEIASSSRTPLEIAKSIVQRFYEPTKKSGESEEVAFIRTKKLDTKLTCYIIILVLMIDGFKTNLSPLMATLRIDEDRISLLARELGCTINKTPEGVIGRLKKLIIESEDKFEKKKKL